MQARTMPASATSWPRLHLDRTSGWQGGCSGSILLVPWVPLQRVSPPIGFHRSSWTQSEWTSKPTTVVRGCDDAVWLELVAVGQGSRYGMFQEPHSLKARESCISGPKFGGCCNEFGWRDVNAY